LRVLIPILLCFINLTYGQTPKDYFRFHSPNKPFLEHLIKIKVDSLRISQELKPLANDSSLFLAAQFHADYLIKFKKLSHNQTNFPKTKTPQQRAELFGALNYIVGENVAKSYAHKKLKNKKGKIYYNYTYNQVATDILTAWINSPGHYANIMMPNYEVTGVSVALDSAKKEIKVVQKFAEVQFKYSFQENTTLFPYTTHKAKKNLISFKTVSRERIRNKFQWGIKAPKDSMLFCTKCNMAVDTNVFKNKLLVKGRRIMFYSPNIDMMHALMSSKKSGLAIELVSYKPVDCGNPQYYGMPSRRNNQSILNGNVLKPLYRKDLKKGFKRSGYKWYRRIKKKGTPTHFEISLGKVPKTFDGYLETNLLVIKDKKLCRVMHFSNACGEQKERFYDVPYLTKLNSYQYGVNPALKSLSFTIPFEQGKYSYSYDNIKPLIDSITSESFTVESITVEAFSSLEGDSIINLNLQHKRAKSIVRAIEERQRSKTKSTIRTGENWSVFLNQIDSIESLSAFKGLRKSEIRTRLNTGNTAITYESFLAKQRYANIKLKVKIDVTDDQIGQFLIAEFNRYKDSISKDLINHGLTQKVKMNLDTMASIQWYAYHLIKSAKLDTAVFEDFKTPINSDYSTIIKDHLWYGLDLSGSGEGNSRWENNFYTQLNNLDRLGISSFEIRYDVMNYLLRNWNNRLPYGGAIGKLEDNINGLLQQASNDSLKLITQQLWVNFHFAKANHTHFSNKLGRNDEDMRESMVLLKDHFLTSKTISNIDRYELALFFVWGEQEDLAYDLLLPQMADIKPYGPSLILFAKLLFSHPEEYATADYPNYLIQIKEKLTTKEWCSLFVGPCNISFQVLDDEKLRALYCESCKTFPNYAQTPDIWVK